MFVRSNQTRICILSYLGHLEELDLIKSEDTFDGVCCMMLYL